MISIMFVDTERHWRGGQDQLYSLLEGLIKRAYSVHLVCYPGCALEERTRRLGVPVHPIKIHTEIDPLFALKFWGVIHKVKPDILAFNTPRAILAGNLASRFAPVKRRIIFRRANFPLHRTVFTKIKYNWGIDCIVAISQSINAQLQIVGVPARRIKTIYEGIDLKQYPTLPATSRNRGASPLTVGCLAHLSPEKGLDHLIEAAALIPQVASCFHFVIVGEGRCRASLERLVLERGLGDCFQFEGFQERTNDYLKTFDIFVLPSISEGLSSAILQAMATSLPVLATDVGGIPELVIDHHNGRLVPAGNAAALAAALQQMAEDPQALTRMGQAGRERLEKHFTNDLKIAETEKLFAALMKQSFSSACA
jgi:glycosyltransferase involved in cell wall biosynthesis